MNTNKWDEIVSEYEGEHQDISHLADYNVMFALDSRLPEVEGIVDNMRRHHYIKGHANRLSNPNIIGPGFRGGPHEHLVREYEASIADKILSEDEILDDIKKIVPQPHGHIANIGWFASLKYEAKRLANYRPRFVESVDEFTDL